MPASNTACCLEGNSTTRPPHFNGSNYIYWNAMMMIYVQSLDYNLWDIVVKVPYVPKSIFNGKTITKPTHEYCGTIFNGTKKYLKSIFN